MCHPVPSINLRALLRIPGPDGINLRTLLGAAVLEASTIERAQDTVPKMAGTRTSIPSGVRQGPRTQADCQPTMDSAPVP
jgi:hypothetical protein